MLITVRSFNTRVRSDKVRVTYVLLARELAGHTRQASTFERFVASTLTMRREVVWVRCSELPHRLRRNTQSRKVLGVIAAYIRNSRYRASRLLRGVRVVVLRNKAPSFGWKVGIQSDALEATGDPGPSIISPTCRGEDIDAIEPLAPAWGIPRSRSTAKPKR